VYKFRVTIDLEAATHEAPKVVRDHLAELAHEAVRAYRAKMPDQVLDDIGRFHVRSKRLDDSASIDPPVTVLVAGALCPHCGAHFKDVTLNVLPFTCPSCKRIIPIDAKGTVRP